MHACSWKPWWGQDGMRVEEKLKWETEFPRSHWKVLTIDEHSGPKREWSGKGARNWPKEVQNGCRREIVDNLTERPLRNEWASLCAPWKTLAVSLVCAEQVQDRLQLWPLSANRKTLFELCKTNIKGSSYRTLKPPLLPIYSLRKHVIMKYNDLINFYEEATEL